MIEILKKGSLGAKVKKLQSDLIKAGFPVGKGGADGDFGKDTDTAVRAFQKSVGIKIDGEVGNDTLTMLAQKLNLVPQKEIPAVANVGLSALAIKKAITQIGVRETPRNSNRGKDVEKYLASIGLGGGYAWCMAFAYWCVNEAAKELKGINPLYKTGGVLMQYNQRPSLRAAKPQAGDLFIMDFGKGAGHTGFVERVDGIYIHTIEGNTNDGGDREGDGVYRRKRKISSINKGFLRV